MTVKKIEQKRRDIWQQFLRISGEEGYRKIADAFNFAFYQAFNLGKAVGADEYIKMSQKTTNSDNLNGKIINCGFLKRRRPERETAQTGIYQTKTADSGLTAGLYSLAPDCKAFVRDGKVIVSHKSCDAEQ